MPNARFTQPFFAHAALAARKNAYTKIKNLIERPTMTTNEHTERAELISSMRTLANTHTALSTGSDLEERTAEALRKAAALLEAQRSNIHACDIGLCPTDGNCSTSLRSELKPLTDERWFQSELFKLAVQKGLLSVHTEHLAGGWSKDITKVSWMEGHNKACDISNEAAHGIKGQQL